MQATNLEILPQTTIQQSRITRRSFVKRSGATVIVLILALDAFRNEARAAEAGGSSSSSGQRILLDYIVPNSLAYPPQASFSGSTNISPSQKITASFAGKEVNYRTKVKETRESWTIDLQVLSTKEPIFSGGPVKKIVMLTYSFTVQIQGGKLFCGGGAGTDQKGDDPLFTGIRISPTSSPDGKVMYVTIQVMTGWGAGGSITGAGVSILGFGGSLNFSPANSPTISISAGFGFRLVPSRF